MAVTFTQEKKTQKYLLAILILIVLAVITIVWFGFLKKDTIEGRQKFPAFARQEAQIDFDLLDNSILDKLYPFEKIAPFEGEKGRENPFLPY